MIMGDERKDELKNWDDAGLDDDARRDLDDEYASDNEGHDARTPNPTDKDEDGTDPDRLTAPKPRRGRPRKNPEGNNNQDREIAGLKSQLKLLQQECRNSEQLITELRSENNGLNEENMDLKSTLGDPKEENMELKCTLADCEAEKIELLEELAGKPAEAPSVPLIRPVGLVVVDEVMSVLMDLLPSNVDWKEARHNINSIQDLTKSTWDKCDLLLIMMGCEDIANGSKGIDVFNTAKKLIDDAKASTKVMISTIPPIQKRGIMGQISLFNYLLEKNMGSDPAVQLIRLDAGSSKMLVDSDGHLTESTAQSYAKCLKSTIKVDNVQPKSTYASAVQSTPTFPGPLMTVIELKKNEIGRIIGRSGFMIQKICKENEVKMRIGKWCEPNKNDKNEYEEVMDGVIISGEVGQVAKAAQKVDELIKMEPAAAAGSSNKKLKLK